MGKSSKKTKAKKGHVKHTDFKHTNVSSLEDHPLAGKTLKSPFSKLPGQMRHSSWYNECIPNIIWACIVASFLERKDYLNLFRKLIVNAREKLLRRKETFVTHNFLAELSADEFDTLLAPILTNDGACSALSALRLVDCLPDRAHWDRHLSEPDPEKDWQILAYAVGETFDHHSERATDIRWLKLLYYIVCQERFLFDPMFADRLEEFRLYPDKGDMNSVQPSIRALEIGTRSVEFGDEPTLKVEGEGIIALPPRHDEQFWAEMQRKVTCILPAEFKPPTPGPAELRDQLFQILEGLDEHFHATITTTSPDPRHDGAFGLALYALTLLLDASISYSHNLVEGRLMLRSIVEAFLNLHFLTSKDDTAIWLQYRRYGSGQAKLAFLKNLREEDVPGFVDLKLLEELANEDMWMEFQDIELGHWAKLDLRKMADEAGVKDVYDKYYDWSSGYAHGHWTCVRDTVFVNCLNPLHRFHRIPAPPKSNMPSILVDACKLVNRMLDDLNHLYPAFKPRLKWHHQAKEAPATAEEAPKAD